MSEKSPALLDLEAFCREPILFEVPCGSGDPWEVAAGLMETLTGSLMLTGSLLARCVEALEAAQDRGETLPVGADRLARLLGKFQEVRGLLVVTSITAAETLEAYPELDEVLPDIEQLIAPVEVAEMERLARAIQARAAEREGP